MTQSHPTDPRIERFARFHELRLAAHSALREAAQLSGLPDHYRAQADATAALCGLKLHRILGEADSNDALALRDDLEIIAKRIDPLIEAIGNEAVANFHNIEIGLFKNQLMGALDGNATHDLTEAAYELDDVRADTIAERRSDSRRAE